LSLHTNINNCLGCEKVFEKYPNLYQPLRDWVYEVRSKHLDAHVSWAGRGKADQELFYKKGLSRAQYGQSAHNYNAAVDFFQLIQTGAYFGTSWYKEVIGPFVLQNPSLRWYGVIEGHHDFLEYPHVELRNWKELVSRGELKLVEPL
jgi:hypothetical protein